MLPLKRIRGRPGDVQFTLAAAVALIIGALIAGALVLVTLIRHLNDPAAPMWGLYLSGLAALGVLAGSFLILGEPAETLPPPD